MTARFPLAAAGVIALLVLAGCSAPASPSATAPEPRCADLLDAFDAVSALLEACGAEE